MAGFSSGFVRSILFSGRAGPRFLNESAVETAIWMAFAADPHARVDMLLVPFDNMIAAELARFLFEQLGDDASRQTRLAPIEGVVAIRLGYADFVRVILPALGMDVRALLREVRDFIALRRGAGTERAGGLTLGEMINFVQQDAAAGRESANMAAVSRLKPMHRVALLVDLIMTAYRMPRGGAGGGYLDGNCSKKADTTRLVDLEDLAVESPCSPPRIWRVSSNRAVVPLGLSVETIKADAANRLFQIDCGDLTWAVIDSGIDGSHPSFADHVAGGYAIRVDKAYDFGGLRDLVSYDALLHGSDSILKQLREKMGWDGRQAKAWLDRLRDDARAGRPYDWQVLSRMLEVAPDRLASTSDGTVNGHGTHVAGVLAGDWRENGVSIQQGVCPSLRLYDLRVLGASEGDTEFAVIAALEFVRWLNSRNRYTVIHGVNLSIGIDYDMANFACGCTPVCMACDATVSSGVVVVVAAGNNGTQTYQTADGYYSGFSAYSITDPGNTEAVITVGATHRERPHEYGVSFFSSRGPTGDGRMKPDLVAPGERIDGPLPNLGLGRLDGTSMAAPHVSGAAALLMARHPELVGKPRRIKSILMDSATDLGRERSFQGAGLVDALRALQSI